VDEAAWGHARAGESSGGTVAVNVQRWSRGNAAGFCDATRVLVAPGSGGEVGSRGPQQCASRFSLNRRADLFPLVQSLAVDLLNPSADKTAQTHKLKRLVQCVFSLSPSVELLCSPRCAL
jgi:hypothetical protein